ncbi:MAG TPA: DNA glycosylase [Mobilitalea sp.]|nr:DNA glycosylase [Mobilitalea sp.]
MKVKSKNFNIKQIADSGQCFRMKQIEENKFGLVAYGRYLELIQVDDETVELSCDEVEFQQIWENYFDLTYYYGAIVADLVTGEDSFLKEAAEYGKGIRILRQEPFEMLISFIISQNKNIPSIKQCITRICETYGETKHYGEGSQIEYHTFPTPEKLAAAEKEELRALKLGYRDEYIIRASQAVQSGSINLPELMLCSHEEAVSALKNIHGIGDKVANCISLYGLHHIEAFPIDVWIKKVLSEIYQNSFSVDRYQGYAGIVQQYMFYYKRYLDGAR